MFPIRDTVPSRHPPVMTWALIAANTGVFLFQLGLPDPVLEQVVHLYGVVPARYTDPDWALSVGLPPHDPWPFLTSLFLHGGFFHLLANLWTLWIFGDNVEDRMGKGRFLAFYLLCGLVATVVHVVANSNSPLPTVGASGAIAGVLGAYLVLFPRSRVVAVFPLLFYPLFFELPAVLYLGLWFLLELFSGTVSLLARQDLGGVAWWAHVGGFACGVVLFRPFLVRRPLAPSAERHFVLADYSRHRGS